LLTEGEGGDSLKGRGKRGRYVGAKTASLFAWYGGRGVGKIDLDFTDRP